MGLITKEVEVKINPANVKYLESKGYIIPMALNKRKKMMPKWGETIMVKVEDLSDGSHSIVEIEYDCCRQFTEIIYKNYRRYNHDGKIYCQHWNSSILNSGNNHPLYNENKTDEERIICRNYPEYIEFVKRVLTRDNYICQCCKNNTSGNAEVHHLDGYNWCMEKRTDDTNGITLCPTCHANFHLQYGKGNNTKEQFEEWLGETVRLLKYNGNIPTSRRVYCIEDEIIYESTQECANKTGTHETSIRRICDSFQYSAKGKHYVWYDKFLKMTQEEINTLLLKKYNCRPVVCITTGKLFDSIKKAEKYYKIQGMYACLCGRCYYSGKLPDGTPLQWMYYEDFLKLPIEEQNEILARNQESSTDDSFIM